MRCRVTLLIVREMQGPLLLLPEPLASISQLGDDRGVVVHGNRWNDLLAMYSSRQIFGEGLIESETGEQGKLD